jgi:signal transduction histidine kinase
MSRRTLLLLVLSIVLPALMLGWLGVRIFDLQRSYFALKAKAAAAGVAVDGLAHGDLLFAYYTTGAMVVMLIGLFMRYLLWRDLRRYKELAAIVSHELRTPLTTIQMYAETLAWRRVPDAARQKEYLETIAKESRRLELVVGNGASRERGWTRARPPPPCWSACRPGSRTAAIKQNWSRLGKRRYGRTGPRSSMRSRISW